MQKKVLITGGSGLLAVNWALSIRDKYEVVLILHNRKISIPGVDVDITSLNSKEDCRSILNKHRPDIVINTVGLASVEQCEKLPEIAHEVHVEIPGNIATICNDLNVKLVHISTDHMLSGMSQMSFEDEIADPVNIYAKTKYQGELKVQNNCKNALIVRTNFFGWGTKYRQSFSDFILNTLKSNNEVELFKDVFFTPILIDELAIRAHLLIDMDAKGVYNIVGNERLSKYEFGLKLANFYELDTDLIKAINLENKTELIKRPKDMSLSNRKLCEVLKCEIPSIDEQILRLKNQGESNINALNQVSVNIIPYGNNYIDESDVAAVVEMLSHSILTQESKVVEFESKVASFVGTKYAVAVTNDIAAIRLVAVVLGLSYEDEIIISPDKFIATSNSILYIGGRSVFVDIDEQTQSINIELIERAIASSKNIKAIFPVHFAGISSEIQIDMEKIKQLADKYNLVIVEDAAHVFGATYKNGNKVGNCQYSDMTVLSFHLLKGIASGEGGMITTNNEKLYQKLLLHRSHKLT